MSTSTQVNELKINKLTKAQYSTITPSETELYFVTDEDSTIPSQTGQSGKFLTTNGLATSWANVDALPSQTGQSGKFLTTDGTDASWAQIEANGANKTLTNLETLGNSRLQYIPFSINTGSVNANGDNNTLSFTTSTLSCATCKITSCDGRILVDDTTRTLSVSAVADGTYEVFKSVDNGALSLISTFTIGNIAPTSPAPTSGDAWLDISVVPANLKVYNGSAWVINNDLVFIGSATVTSGEITDISNRTFNDDFDTNPHLDEIYPVVETYSNGASWYRVYSDNWCEQGGYLSAAGSVNLLKTYANTNYDIVSMAIASATVYVSAITTSTFTVTGGGCRWISSGYLPLEKHYAE